MRPTQVHQSGHGVGWLVEPESPVGDDEWLFRSIRADPSEFVTKDGKRIVQPRAFADAAKEPSVDRACLCEDEPEHARKSDTDGVVSFQTNRVRQVHVVKGDPKGPPAKLTKYSVDVHPEPVYKDNPHDLPENLAHAVARAAPTITSDKVFRRLRESLARIATEHGVWRIEPNQSV
jgi:hypothetical protein